MRKLGCILVTVLCLGTFANVSFAMTEQEAKAQLVEVLKTGDAKKLMEMLPASWIRDMNNVVRTFGGKMDEELWQKSRETAALVADVLAAQAENAAKIVAQGSLPGMGGGGKPAKGGNALDEKKAAQAREGFKALAEFLRGDAMELKTLQTTDVSALIFELAPILSKVTEGMNLKISDDDSSMLDIGAMKKVDGKWVPAEMAKGWNESIADALKGIRDMEFTSDSARSEKMQIISMMDSVRPMLKQIESAKSPEQFTQQLMMMMMPYLMMQMR